MKPSDEYYKSEIITVDHISENERVEILSDKPIEVRINNGPWVKISPSDLNNI